jgi:hypothetical protein
MRFVKFKRNTGSIIQDKEYLIKVETDDEFCFIDEDDELDIRYTSESKNDGYEIIDRPVMVYAYDDIDLGTVELELVHDLGEGFEYRYVCKNVNGEITGWREIGYVKNPEPEPELNEFKHDFEVMKHEFESLKLQMKEVLRLLNEKI